MDIEVIRGRLDRIRETLLRGGEFNTDWAVETLSAALEHLGADEDEPPVDVDDGFVILPVARYEALREAEEHLQETRFEPTDGEDSRHAPGPTARAPQFHPVLDKHLHDLQAEIDKIKDRLEAITQHVGAVNLRYVGLKRQADDITDRLDVHDKTVGLTSSTVFDRLGAMTARLNKIEAMTRPIGPLRDPVLGPAAREKVEEAKTRLLREAFERGDGRVESTVP